MILVLTTILISCNGQPKSNNENKSEQNILVQNTAEDIKRNPRDYVKNYDGESNKLFVFVGQKISVDNLPHEENSMDASFKAKYIVLQKVFGDFARDTIEFVAYDHLIIDTIPEFSTFDNVLLFVSADSGTYFHQKHMYNDVYLTKSGKWAGTYADDDYGHEYNNKTKIKPIKIDFANEVSYPATFNKENSKYPKPYFKIVGNKAIAMYGNYVDELFILKRDGYLTAREIFKDGKLQ